ncbi:MAG: response regulator [Gemmataceae bacterium]
MSSSRPGILGPKILIADDEEAICFVLSRRARVLGLQPLVAADGQAARQLFEVEEDIEAALLVWLMPRFDGLQLAERIHTHKPELPLSIMTAFDTRLPAEATARFTVLAKPFDLDAFDELLTAWGLVPAQRSAAG